MTGYYSSGSDSCIADRVSIVHSYSSVGAHIYTLI